MFIIINIIYVCKNGVTSMTIFEWIVLNKKNIEIVVPFHIQTLNVSLDFFSSVLLYNCDHNYLDNESDKFEFRFDNL